MGGIYALVLIFTAVGAVLSIPVFWLWAWAAGPAVKRLARSWEEGRQQAVETHFQQMEYQYQRGVKDALDGKFQRVTAPPLPDERLTAHPQPSSKRFSITGRELP